MKLTTLTAAVVAALAFVHSAQAREHDYRRGVHHYARYVHHYARYHVSTHLGSAPSRFGSTMEMSGYERLAGNADRRGYGGRPSAWCGWQMRHLVDSDPGPQFNLARNWSRWGHAGPAGVGAVVVWPHHVGKIVGQEGGKWIIQSGNDGGNRMRTRPRSIGGAIAIRWG
jgi:hypothetical protein